MPRFVRMTITVPAGLRARMRDEADPPNWSAVASDAFNERLNFRAIAAGMDESGGGECLPGSVPREGDHPACFLERLLRGGDIERVVKAFADAARLGAGLDRVEDRGGRSR